LQEDEKNKEIENEEMRKRRNQEMRSTKNKRKTVLPGRRLPVTSAGCVRHSVLEGSLENAAEKEGQRKIEEEK